MSFFRLCILVIFVNCSSFGTNPNDEKIEKFKKLKNYNAEEEAFENRVKGLQEIIDERIDYTRLFDWFSKDGDKYPIKKLPEMKPNVAEFVKPSNKLKMIWLGHSSFLLNLEGSIVLVDPIFSDHAAPFSFMVERFQDPVLQLEELPEIDFILISHDHYDHLDHETILFFKDKNVRFIVPLGVGSHLAGWGIQKNKIIERNWWERATFKKINFVAAPSQHFSGRGLKQNSTLWSSWIIQTRTHNVYFSGDSGYDTHFKEIGKRYGPFDLVLLDNGQYNEEWREMHMFPSEVIQAFDDLQAKKLFPVHWGMFSLAYHAWYTPIVEIYNLSQEHNIPLVAPKIGQIIAIEDYNLVEEWWLKAM